MQKCGGENKDLGEILVRCMASTINQMMRKAFVAMCNAFEGPLSGRW